MKNIIDMGDIFFGYGERLQILYSNIFKAKILQGNIFNARFFEMQTYGIDLLYDFWLQNA